MMIIISDFRLQISNLKVNLEINDFNLKSEICNLKLLRNL